MRCTLQTIIFVLFLPIFNLVILLNYFYPYMFLLPSQEVTSSRLDDSDLGLSLDEEDDENDEDEEMEVVKPNIQKKFNQGIPEHKKLELRDKIARINEEIKKKQSLVPDFRKPNRAIVNSLKGRKLASPSEIIRKKKFYENSFMDTDSFQNKFGSNADKNVNSKLSISMKNDDFEDDDTKLEWEKMPKHESFNDVEKENSLDPWIHKDAAPKKFALKDAFAGIPVTKRPVWRNSLMEARNKVRQFTKNNNGESFRPHFNHAIKSGISNRWESNSRNWHEIPLRKPEPDDDSDDDNDNDDDDDDDDE